MRYKFLKFEVFGKSASLVPIFKWSWNESTTFTCQNIVNWQWTNVIPLLQTKTADTAHTEICDQALSPIFGQGLGMRLVCD